MDGEFRMEKNREHLETGVFFITSKDALYYIFLTMYVHSRLYPSFL